jgi:hypothetical protein
MMINSQTLFSPILTVKTRLYQSKALLKEKPFDSSLQTNFKLHTKKLRKRVPMVRSTIPQVLAKNIKIKVMTRTHTPNQLHLRRFH